MPQAPTPERAAGRGMGTLSGHLALALLIYHDGLYCTVMVSRALSRSQELLFPPLAATDKQGQRWWQRVRAEGMVKMGTGKTLILGQFFFPPGTSCFPLIDWEDPRRPFQHHHAWQRATIFGFFLSVTWWSSQARRGWLSRA